MPTDPVVSDADITKVQRVMLMPSGAASEFPAMAGELVAERYQLVRYLGSGGIGVVVAARHLGFDEQVALKFLRPSFCSEAHAVSRFSLEARASFKLNSEHVARVLDVDTHRGIPFMAMELLDGITLREQQLATQRVSPAVLVDYMLQVCEALAAAHVLGIVHRDIKPENLFLIGDLVSAHVKVLDFGISKLALESDVRRPSDPRDTHLAVGTPAYMSPEQMRGVADLDGRSDLFSVGCVSYELLTGQLPFERESAMSSCAAVLEEEPTPLHELRPDIPRALADIVTRCLRKKREERFQDTAELAHALVPFGTGRFASYPARCQSHLNGERLGRRSTPPGAPSRPSSDTFATPLVPSSTYPVFHFQATPNELLRMAPDPFRAPSAPIITPVRPRSVSLGLAWLLPLLAASLLALYLWRQRERQPTLYEARPRALPIADTTAPASHVSLELEQPGAAELPAGLSDADKPRTRRRATPKVEAKPENKAEPRSSSTQPPSSNEEPDVGF